MITDDTLLLYYYKDGLSSDELQSISSALNEDQALRDRYQQLCSELDTLNTVALSPAPAHLTHQWHEVIDNAAQQPVEPRGTPRLSLWSWLGWGLTVTATLLIGISLGGYFAHQNEPFLPPPQVANSHKAPFARGLEVYLEQSQTSLAQVVSFDAPKSQLLEEIIHQNRLFEQAAEQNHAPEVARVLRAFEPILLQLASEELSPSEEQDLRKQLVFEMKIILTKLAQADSNKTHSI